jgi:hypothetical protein
MSRQQLDRRRFLVVALSLTGAALGFSPSILAGGKAWFASMPRERMHEALTRAARLLYPHDALGDEVYAEVLEQAMTMVADDSRFERLLQDADAALEESLSGPFFDATPEAQLAALQSIDQEAYFGPIQAAVANCLYSHPKAWEMMAYEGPSWTRGGWLDRGAGDIDWLPEDGT